MNRNTLNRYQRTPDNKILIEITAGEVKHLYNDFDRHAPYIRKELDAELTEYLIDSVTEIGNENFVIHFLLNKLEETRLIERVKASIHNYFIYLIEREKREMVQLQRNSLIYSLIGIALLSLSYWLEQAMNQNSGFLTHILSQGLVVAAWVSLWNAIATFLINWKPHRDLTRLYRRISQAEITFSETGQESP